MLDLVLAVFLLTSPQCSEVIPSEQQWEVVRNSVKKVAIDWEILDKRETNYILSKREDFSNDINLLRRRVEEFKNYPHLYEFRKFPPRADVNDMIRLNRDYRKELEDRLSLELHLQQELTRAIRETDRIYSILDGMRDSGCEFYYVTVRRQALARIKDLLGEEFYEASYVPPAVPLSR